VGNIKPNQSSLEKLVGGYSSNEVLQLCLPALAYHTLLH